MHISKLYRVPLKRLVFTAILLLSHLFVISGQTENPAKYIQVSGIISDVLHRPVPGVAVISRKLRRGTASEWSGIYSITSTPGDTVFFRAMGYKRYHTIIPPDFEDRQCMVDIVLEADTITIKEVTILPWRSYNEFIKDITKERPVDPIIENMNDNIASIYVAIANQTSYRVSPEAGYKYAMEQNFSALSTKNQYPVNNLLNPFAWAKFVNGLKNGLLKNQKLNKPEVPKIRKKIKKKKND